MLHSLGTACSLRELLSSALRRGHVYGCRVGAWMGVCMHTRGCPDGVCLHSAGSLWDHHSQRAPAGACPIDSCACWCVCPCRFWVQLLSVALALSYVGMQGVLGPSWGVVAVRHALVSLARVKICARVVLHQGCGWRSDTGLIRVLKFGGVLSFGGVLASSRCQCGGCRGHQQAVLCTACVRCACVCVWRRGARICCLQLTLQSMLLVVQDALHGTRVLLQLHGCICYVQAAISARSQHMCMLSFSLLCLSTVRWCVLGAWG